MRADFNWSFLEFGGVTSELFNPSFSDHVDTLFSQFMERLLSLWASFWPSGKCLGKLNSMRAWKCDDQFSLLSVKSEKTVPQTLGMHISESVCLKILTSASASREDNWGIMWEPCQKGSSWSLRVLLVWGKEEKVDLFSSSCDTSCAPMFELMNPVSSTTPLGNVSIPYMTHCLL